MDNACQNRKRFGRLIGGTFMLFGLVFVLTGMILLAIFGFLLSIPVAGLSSIYSRRNSDSDALCYVG